MIEIENILNKVSSRVSLTDRERVQMRGYLENLVDSGKVTSPVSPLSPWLDGMFFVRRHALGLSFVALLFFSGTTGALADRALPGDLLYPLKTNINEEVLGWFSVSDYDKAELSLRIAERRLTEAETIENKEVDQKVREDHRVLLEKQVNDADLKAARFGDSQKIKVNSENSSVQQEKQTETSTTYQATMMLSEPVTVENIAVDARKFQEQEGVYENNVQKREELREVFKSLQKKLATFKKRKQFREALIPIEAQLLKTQKMILDVKKIKNDELSMETSSTLLIDIESSLVDIEHSLVSLEDRIQDEFEGNLKDESSKYDEKNNETRDEKKDETPLPEVL